MAVQPRAPKAMSVLQLLTMISLKVSWQKVSAGGVAVCTPQFAWDGSVGWEARCFFSPWAAQLYRQLHFLTWIQQVCFHVLPPCSFPLRTPCAQGDAQGAVPCVFPGSQDQKFPHQPCPWQLVPCAEPPGLMPQGRPSPAQGMGRESHPPRKCIGNSTLFSAQNLEQFRVFAFVLGLNMCLAISQSYLICRGVVRLPNLTHPVTSADGWPISIKLFYLFHLGWFKSWSFKSFVTTLLLA